MKPVVTLTVNPALDTACVADEVVPMRKVRTRDERYEAGGGGINVARMVHELGGEAVAFYLAGGMTGQALEGLVEHSGVAAVRVPISGQTRVSHTVFETSTGHEFRFTPEGPEVTESEWHNCLEVLSIVDGDYFVASGSLARGLPNDFYARVARMVKARVASTAPSAPRVSATYPARPDSATSRARASSSAGVCALRPARCSSSRLLGLNRNTPSLSAWWSGAPEVSRTNRPPRAFTIRATRA